MRKHGVGTIEVYQNTIASARHMTHGRYSFNLHKDTNPELTGYIDYED